MNARAPFLPLGLLLVAALSCSGEEGIAPPSPDAPGRVTVMLDAPHGDVGALIVTLRGPGLSADDNILPAVPAYDVFSRGFGTEQRRVVVIGDVSAGRAALFSLQVGASNRPQAYTVTVDQVATRGNALRDDLTGYRASLSAAAQP